MTSFIDALKENVEQPKEMAKCGKKTRERKTDTFNEYRIPEVSSSVRERKRRRRGREKAIKDYKNPKKTMKTNV